MTFCCFTAGTVRVYDYLAKKQLCEAKFTTGGSSLIWAPEIVSFFPGITREIYCWCTIQDLCQTKELLHSHDPENFVLSKVCLFAD